MIIENLQLSYGDQIIFNNCNLKLDENCKVGIIGVNGAGKTTLLNLLSGELLPDSGTIIYNKGTRIGYLKQSNFEEQKDSILTIEFIKSGRPIKYLEDQLRIIETQLSDPNKYDTEKCLKMYTRITTLLEYWDWYNCDSELQKIIKGMNISDKILQTDYRNISGGERRKIDFAKLLYSHPTTLLLDEPTNHLDAPSINWCCEYLKNYKGQVLIISHDHKFLNSIIDKVLYIDKKNHTLSLYNGNCDTYTKIMQTIKLSNERLVKKQELEEKRLENIIKSLDGVSGKRKRMAFSKEKSLQRLRSAKVEKIQSQPSAKIFFKYKKDSNKVSLDVRNLNFSYSNSPLLHNITFSIGSHERVLIAGNNGTGKSTLLKLIVGELCPTSGNINVGTKTKIAYYDQEQIDINTSNKTIFEYFLDLGVPKKTIIATLNQYLFYKEQLNKPIHSLSPGEKCRLSFVRLALIESNMLILDEPTNHIDPITQTQIAENLDKYEGAILLVSHNTEFVDRLRIDKMILLPSCKITNYNKDILKTIENHNDNLFSKT